MWEVLLLKPADGKHVITIHIIGQNLVTQPWLTVRAMGNATWVSRKMGKQTQWRTRSLCCILLNQFPSSFPTPCLLQRTKIIAVLGCTQPLPQTSMLQVFFYIKLEAPCMKFMQEQALTTPVASQHHPSPTGYSRRWFQKVVPPSGPVSYQLFIIQDSLLPIYCHMMLEICYQKQNTSLTNEFIYLHQTALQLC